MSGKSTATKRRGRPPKKGRLSLNRRQRLERERRKKILHSPTCSRPLCALIWYLGPVPSTPILVFTYWHYHYAYVPLTPVGIIFM